MTIAKEESPDKLVVIQTLQTQRGSRTMALDPTTHRIYLAAAKFEAPAGGATVAADDPRHVQNSGLRDGGNLRASSRHCKSFKLRACGMAQGGRMDRREGASEKAGYRASEGPVAAALCHKFAILECLHCHWHPLN